MEFVFRELRAVAGSTFSIQNQGNAFQQSNSHFGPVFVVSTSFKPVNSIGDSNLNRSSRNSGFEESSTTLFGSPKNSGIGFNSTPPNLHSNSASNSTSSIFGVKVPPFAPAGSSSIFGTSSISGIQGFSGGHTPWDGQSLASASFKTFDSPANIFRNPPLSNQSSFSSPFHPFKSNLSDPKSQDLVTPNSTTSPSPNPFSLAKSNLFQSQAFIPQPTVVSSMPTFNANLNPSFVTPFSESGQTNSCQCPTISTTSTSPSVSSTFSLSKISSTVTPSTQSTSLAVLGPWPSEPTSIPNASQPGETAEKLDCHFTNNLSQPSLGKGCEDKDLPNCSFQHNVNPTWVTGGDTSIQEQDLPSILNQHQDNDTAVIQKHEADVLALMPKLPNGEYYMEPSLKELAAKEMAEPGSCTRVNNFVVGRLGYGNIKFLGETDVRYLDLESVVQFNDREVIVYADDRKKPPVGQSLNKPAEVTLLNVKCISKKAGKQYVDGPQVRSFKERLMKKASEQGAEFVSYDPVQGEWKFRVEHF
ncbi:hypothetical protein DH2020_026760 [Rehmannia glutinosa]|uniref:Peptidase S59 domain-containing protein n=1 Tax=Rehmannia glutinosa TaxID=99300 RepID=A0ABR0VZ00_REHGL